MSFTQVVKEEVCKLEISKLEGISELSAIIRGGYSYNNTIILENSDVAKICFNLLKSLYDVIPIITVRNKKLGKGYTYILNIEKNKDSVLEDLSIFDNNVFLDVPKDYILSDNEQLRAYLRGVFLVSGSVNDPKTSRYHLEFVLDTKKYAEFISKILNKYNLNSKIIKREKKYTVYVKEAEKISDFLRIIKAFNAIMYFEDIRIFRDHQNMTNRLNNCEQANVDKIFMTASRQIKDIEKLIELDMIDMLDDKLKEAIEYRMKYRESSLQELADIISYETENNITKSGLNHRFRKIRDIVSKLTVNRN